MRVLLEGPILTQSGYGEHTRLVYRALKTDKSLDIFLNPLNWGQTGWVQYLNEEEKQSIDESVKNFSKELEQIKKNNKKAHFDLHIHVGLINEYSRKASYSVCVTAGIETDKISKNWVMKTYKDPPNKIIFPSNHAKDIFENTSYPGTFKGKSIMLSVNSSCELEVVPYPVKSLDSGELDMNIETKFNFLSVALDSPRKNLSNMISWFVQEFEKEDVGLILKTGQRSGSILDREETILNLSNILKNYPERKCKIYLLHGDLSDSQIHSLYNRSDIHAYLTTTRGEGYGLPIFEAAYSGMPVIATDWSGHLDFLVAPYKESGKIKDKKLFAKLDYSLKPVKREHLWPGVIEAESKWAEVKESSVKKQMRNVYKNYGMYKKWAMSLKEHVEATHSEEKILEAMRVSIVKDCKPQDLQTLELQELEGYSDEIIL